MSILEITLSIGIGIFLAAAAMTQISFQAQTITAHRDVEYYASEVPRTISALQNISRGAHTYRIGTNANTGVNIPGGLWAATATGARTSGNALAITSRVGDRGRMESYIWLQDKTQTGSTIEGDFIVDPAAQGGGRSFQENRFDLLVSTRVIADAGGIPPFPAGWALNRNIAGIQFDIIPDSGGAVLMTVLKRMRNDAGVAIAFQTILERR
jgi:hypothetical protein